MRKVLDGSRIERGRKNRTNMRKKVISAPATVAQTMRRRILLTGGSEVVSTVSTGFAGAAEPDLTWAGTFSAPGRADI
jgi:hypothetical protein